MSGPIPGKVSSVERPTRATRVSWPGGEAAAHWAPIDGVTLEGYAQITRDMAAAGVAGPDAIERFVASRGVAPGTWSRIATGWSTRMARDQAIRARFDELLQLL